MNKFRCLNIIQVRCSVPRGCHHLLPSNQPISSYDHSLVAFERRQWNPNGRAVTGHISIDIRLIFIRALNFVFSRYLLLRVKSEKKDFLGTLEVFSDMVQTIIYLSMTYSLL
jgi:hypothetical protein